MKIALAPLDERPVNTRYPSQIAAIAGAEVALPPLEIRGAARTPADTAAVAAWLREQAESAEGLVASVEYLAWGNLINSRISHETTAEGLARLAPLVQAKESGALVYAFALITRVANANDCVEEPLWWKTYGTRCYALSQLLHKQTVGALEAGEVERIATLRAEVPTEHLREFLTRRERNHALNLSVLNLLASEKLSFLLITSDDTSQWGLPSREKAWLESWADLLDVRGRMMLHPGADEVGSALTARLLCEKLGRRPRIFPLYALPGDEAIIAPYEDRAVRLTVEGQIGACGGLLAGSPEDADLILGVLTPSPRRTEWRADFADAERAARQGAYEAFFAELGKFQDSGKLVALGDVAYPNGADPLAMDLLFAESSPCAPGKLASFGAWNTAGNSLGTTVAQAVALWLAGDKADLHAQNIALTHHFLEGWGYQTEVRREARAKNTERFGHHDPAPPAPNDGGAMDQIAFTCASIEAGLQLRLAQLQKRGVGVGLTLVPGSVTLPWSRTFECDFELV
ncbi:DUF4127 family protein [Armatimonas rosea]|uniref:DUF4127 family protein n=1 Tax=Armatimonas rosea TaxID=685828 RepID=A0A7W9SLX6_ARMRO|nr:hypothetical protein [Armatimonas rosea]